MFVKTLGCNQSSQKKSKIAPGIPSFYDFTLKILIFFGSWHHREGEDTKIHSSNLQDGTSRCCISPTWCRQQEMPANFVHFMSLPAFVQSFAKFNAFCFLAKCMLGAPSQKVCPAKHERISMVMPCCFSPESSVINLKRLVILGSPNPILGSPNPNPHGSTVQPPSNA